MTELKRILFIDDDPDIRQIARVALETVGKFAVEICASGSEALLRAPDSKAQLILLDALMPDMDGPMTLMALRQLPSMSAIPAVFLTAKTDPRDVDLFLELGAAGVLSKPFNPLELAKSVREIWARSAADPTDP
jgi:CheY-like chemotaxis protein